MFETIVLLKLCVCFEADRLCECTLQGHNRVIFCIKFQWFSKYNNWGNEIWLNMNMFVKRLIWEFCNLGKIEENPPKLIPHAKLAFKNVSASCNDIYIIWKLMFNIIAAGLQMCPWLWIVLHQLRLCYSGWTLFGLQNAPCW